MKKIIVLLILALPLMVSAGTKGEFRIPAVARPAIPANIVKLTDFGAKGDGTELCTKAFSEAMKALTAKGGGILEVPAGIWLTGPIQFENNIELRTSTGTLILFTDDINAYPEVDALFEGNTTKRRMSPLYAYGKENIAITGHGTFDGNGQAWRPVKKSKLTESQWKKLIASGGSVEKYIWFPEPRSRVSSRPTLLDFMYCKKVLLQDVTFSNSPAWNVHPCVCEDVTIERVNIKNPWYAQNGDGLDLESCTRAQILDTTFDVGDDAICIKSGKDAEGRKLGKPCQQVIISGCTVLRGHGGFVIGSEMSGGANDIRITNCVFNGTDTGIRFKSTRGRGGLVRNIFLDNIRMNNIAEDAFTCTLYYANKPVGGKADKATSAEDAIPPVTEETPCFKDIFLDNIVCHGAGRAIYFNGLPEMPIQNVIMENSLFVAKKGADINYAEDIDFSTVTIKAETGETMVETHTKAIKSPTPFSLP